MPQRIYLVKYFRKAPKAEAWINENAKNYKLHTICMDTEGILVAMKFKEEESDE